MEVKGRVLKYGDNVNTDLIIPGKYLVSTDPKELANHAMEGLDPAFSQKILSRGLIVAGKNFGCGSSREQAPIALKYGGTQCVIAESFARIFYRNAVNVGLPVLECKGIQGAVGDDDELVVELKAGLIENLTKNERYKTTPVPDFMLDIMKEGLIEYVKKRKGQAR